MSIGYTSFSGYDDTKSSQVLIRAADLGITFWDTSNIYGPNTNEELLSKWFKDAGRRNEIFLATKFANSTKDGQTIARGDAVYVNQACPASLERLGVYCLDLYY